MQTADRLGETTVFRGAVVAQALFRRRTAAFRCFGVFQVQNKNFWTVQELHFSNIGPSPHVGSYCRNIVNKTSKLGDRALLKKGHFRQHRNQMCVWCYIFTSRLSLKQMILFYEVNTMCLRPVFPVLFKKRT